MNDEAQETTAPTAEATPEATAVPAENAPAYASETFVVAQNLDHDRVSYKEGATVSGSVFTPEQFALLRAEGILKYAHEVQAAEDVAKQLADKSAALASAQAELERLRQQLEAAQRTAKGK